MSISFIRSVDKINCTGILKLKAWFKSLLSYIIRPVFIENILSKCKATLEHLSPWEIVEPRSALLYFSKLICLCQKLTSILWVLCWYVRIQSWSYLYFYHDETNGCCKTISSCRCFVFSMTFCHSFVRIVNSNY